MSKVHRCRDLDIFVFVEDTDFQGIVYHANYLKYFERARSSCLKDLDISQSEEIAAGKVFIIKTINCLLYTSPSPRDRQKSRMPSSA